MSKIEIYSDGTSNSDDVIEKVKQQACPKCEILVYGPDEKAGAVASRPAVFMNGKPVRWEKLHGFHRWFAKK